MTKGYYDGQSLLVCKAGFRRNERPKPHKLAGGLWGFAKHLFFN
jgi:hypothetical protein